MGVVKVLNEVGGAHGVVKKGVAIVFDVLVETTDSRSLIDVMVGVVDSPHVSDTLGLDEDSLVLELEFVNTLVSVALSLSCRALAELGVGSPSEAKVINWCSWAVFLCLSAGLTLFHGWCSVNFQWV